MLIGTRLSAAMEPRHHHSLPAAGHILKAAPPNDHPVQTPKMSPETPVPPPPYLGLKVRQIKGKVPPRSTPYVWGG